MTYDTQHLNEERSLGDLFVDLTHEVTQFVRQEMTLAKTEMGQKASRIGKQVGFLVAGGAVAYAGFLTLLAAVVFLLARAGMSLGAAALLVGVVVAVIGGALVWKGIEALKSTDLVPRETLESLKH
jgi:hypothetical protein